MDWIRRAYITKIRPWQGSTEEVEIRWYRADRDAKVYTDWSRFRSLSTWERGTPKPKIGEQLPANRTTYDRGLNVGQWKGQHAEGPAEAWREGGKIGVTPVITTGAHGGTEECPWGGPLGPVVIASTKKGKGYVLAIASPSIIRIPDDTGQPVPDWNADFWGKVNLWLRKVARDQPYAAPSFASRWRMVAARPTASNVAGDQIDYSTEELQYGLWQQLKDIAVLYTGWNGLDFAGDHDYLNPDIYYVIHAWVNDGGVLVVVNNTSQWDTDDPPRNNVLLEALNVEMRFIRGRIGPRYPVTQPAVANEAHSSPGSQPVPYQWADPSAIVPPLIGATYIVARVPPAVNEYLAIRFPSYPVIGFPAVRVTIEATVSRNAGGTIGRYSWFTISTVTPVPFLDFHQDLPETDTPFKWSKDPVFLSPNPSFPWFIGFRVEAASGTPTVTIRHIKVTLQGCQVEPCGYWGLFVNKGHELVSDPPGYPLCGVNWMDTSTIDGGDWIADIDPQRAQLPCGPSGAQGGGQARQGTPGILHSTGGGRSGGTARQYSRAQFATGGGWSGGTARQGLRQPVQTGSGGAQSGGTAGQYDHPILTSSGGAQSGGGAYQLLRRPQQSDGGGWSGGVAVQPGRPPQQSDGGGWSGGVAVQQLRAPQESDGGGWSGGTATQGMLNAVQTSDGGAWGGGDAMQRQSTSVQTGDGGGEGGGDAVQAGP